MGPVRNLLGSTYKKPSKFGLTKELVDTNDRAVAVCVVSITALPCLAIVAVLCL